MSGDGEREVVVAVLAQHREQVLHPDRAAVEVSVGALLDVADQP